MEFDGEIIFEAKYFCFSKTLAIHIESICPALRVYTHRK